MPTYAAILVLSLERNFFNPLIERNCENLKKYFKYKGGSQKTEFTYKNLFVLLIKIVCCPQSTVWTGVLINHPS